MTWCIDDYVDLVVAVLFVATMLRWHVEAGWVSEERTKFIARKDLEQKWGLKS